MNEIHWLTWLLTGYACGILTAVIIVGIGEVKDKRRGAGIGGDDG